MHRQETRQLYDRQKNVYLDTVGFVDFLCIYFDFVRFFLCFYCRYFFSPHITTSFGKYLVPHRIHMGEAYATKNRTAVVTAAAAISLKA